MAATSIIVNGVQTRRPGAYSVLDTTALAGAGAQARGVVAIVGSLELLDPLVPTRVASANALKRLLPDSGAQLASLLFTPSRDSRIPAGAQQLVLVRPDCTATPVARASLTVDTVGGLDSVVWSAASYGAQGNRTSVTLADGTVRGTRKVTVALDGASEVHDNIGGQIAFTVEYGEAEADDVTLLVQPDAVAPSPTVCVAYSKLAVPGAYSPDKMAFDGTIQFTLSAPAPVGGVAFAILGLASDGATTETVTIAEAASTATSAKRWTSVTSITPTGLAGRTYDLDGYAFQLVRTSYGTVQQVVDRINTKSAQGFTAAVTMTTGAATFSVADLDYFPNTTCFGVAVGPLFDLYSLVLVVNRDSDLLTAAKATGAIEPPANHVAAYLTGGSDGGTPSATDWEDAFAALQDQFVNLVVPLSDDAAVHEKLRAHLVTMWGMGRDERQGYVGVPTGTAKSSVVSKIAALNSPYVQLVAQEIQVYAPDGTATWLSPTYLALLAAGMQAGRAVGEPLTWKYPNVLDFRQASDWTPAEDAEEMLSAGLMFLGRSHVGIRWERSLTTYLQADNPILTEMSAMESAGECCKDLRRYLELLVGGNNADVTARSIYNLGSARLTRQKDRNDLGLIRDWRNLSVEDLGDGYDISFEVAPIEPVNFLRITAHVVRIPTTV